jgi:hypothetical protein
LFAIHHIDRLVAIIADIGDDFSAVQIIPEIQIQEAGFGAAAPGQSAGRASSDLDRLEHVGRKR